MPRAHAMIIASLIIEPVPMLPKEPILLFGPYSSILTLLLSLDYFFLLI